MTFKLTPQNPVLKAYSEDNNELHVDLTFHAMVGGVDGSSLIPSKWTWSFKDKEGKIIGPDGKIAEVQKDAVVTNAGISTLPIPAPRFITAGRYILSVTAEHGGTSMPLETQYAEMQVVPSNIDERDSFIACGADGQYYLVALTFKTTGGSQNPGEKQVIQLVSIREGQPVIPEGFSPEDVGRPAPLARSIPKTVGATFITCVMVNLESKDNHKFSLLPEQRVDAMAERLGSSSTKVHK